MAAVPVVLATSLTVAALVGSFGFGLGGGVVALVVGFGVGVGLVFACRWLLLVVGLACVRGLFNILGLVSGLGLCCGLGLLWLRLHRGLLRFLLFVLSLWLFL